MVKPRATAAPQFNLCISARTLVNGNQYLIKNFWKLNIETKEIIVKANPVEASRPVKHVPTPGHMVCSSFPWLHFQRSPEGRSWQLQLFYTLSLAQI